MTTPHLPDNWTHVTGRPLTAPTVILDLDGVIADAAHRQHHLRADPPDWEGFNRTAAADPPIASGLALVSALALDHNIAIVTARPVSIVDLTREWLDAHRIRHDVLVLRPDADIRPSPDVKRSALHQLRDRGADVRFAVDDDIRNVEMYRAEGVLGLYVHSGYYVDGAV